MAMESRTRFSHMAGAPISIGWALKLNSDAKSNDRTKAICLPVGSESFSCSTTFGMSQQNVSKKYIIHAIFDEEDIYCLWLLTS